MPWMIRVTSSRSSASSPARKRSQAGYARPAVSSSTSGPVATVTSPVKSTIRSSPAIVIADALHRERLAVDADRAGDARPRGTNDPSEEVTLATAGVAEPRLPGGDDALEPSVGGERALIDDAAVHQRLALFTQAWL
jgi:hypothetical protein